MAGTFCLGVGRASPARRAHSYSLRPLALAAGLAWGLSASAETLSEQDVIARAEQRSTVQALVQNRWQAAQSASHEAALWPNPVVTVDRTEVDGAGGNTTELTYQIAQTFDLSGRRRLSLAAADQRLQSAQAQQAEQRQQRIEAVRRAFAEVLYRQQQLAILVQWQERIAAASETVQKLAKAGEASGYDRRRLQQEWQAAEGRRDQAQADLLLAQAHLAGVAGMAPDPSRTVAGDLLPEAGAALASLRAQLAQRPDLQSLQAQAKASALEGRAAGRIWGADLTVGLGQKTVDGPAGSGEGLALSVVLPLPVWDRGQVKASRLHAEAEVWRAEQVLRRSEADAQMMGRWQHVEQLRQAAGRLRQESLPSARELVRIAEVAYRGGEVSVLELLDAYRTELGALQDVLELERRARLARIELDVLVGVVP